MRGMAGLRGRGVPLRVGLVAATLVLVACGLLASGIAVTSILRHTLINRVDETLLDASAAGPRRRAGCRRPRWKGPTRPGRRRTSTSAASTPTAASGWRSTTATPNRRCPTTTTWVRYRSPSGRSTTRDVQWRAMTVRGPRGELTTVAIDLSDVQSTVAR